MQASTERARGINSSELFLLKELIEKAVADNTLFLHSFPRGQGRDLLNVATAGKGT